MVFSSETFLFLFLPGFLALYYLTPWRWKSATLLAGSYVFYAWWRVDFLLLLVGTTIWAYLVGRAIRASDGRRRRVWTGIGVAGCLGVLGIFKYLGFFLDSLTALFGTTPDAIGLHWQVLLPIGVSFYVFQSVSYLIDTHRGDAPDDGVSLLDFAAFIALFPQLIAGPILRYKDLAHQFRHRTHSLDLFTSGMERFFIGLAKKVLLADAVAPLADLAFGTADPSLALAWLGAVAYMMQLYFDFSGYSDMAIGLGMMLGFRFVENFDTPYVARSITEFWQRWHISLSIWLRDYLYIPLGGNRAGAVRTYLNLMTVMVLGGLWHGAAWTYVFWGAWHGGWLAFERYSGWARARSPAALLRTLLVVLLGWVMFRAASVPEAASVLAGMAGLNGIALGGAAALEMTRESLVFLALALLVATLEPAFRRAVRTTPGVSMGGGAVTVANTLLPSAAITLIAGLTVLKLAEQSFSPFLYFQF